MMELETASTAATLGIGNWRITYSIETATRSPGIHVKAINSLNQGEYKSFSFGESQRVKLAVSLGLASLIQSLAGIYISIEAWDEPTNWLSPEGIDDLLDCLYRRAETTKRTTWLIDHRSLSFPFDATYEAVKTKEGTTINRLA
jgi:energy-coupling factor transporter ATP-binding protein EcfA2